MRILYKFTLYLFIISISIAGAFAQGVEIRLEQKGKYFLPLENRFEPSYYSITGVDTAETTIAFLSYTSINHRYSAMVYWDLGLVVIQEWVIGKNVFSPRVVPIDQFLLYLSKNYWAKYSWESAKEAVRTKKGGISFEIPIEFPKGVRDVIGEGGAGLQVTGFRKITLSGRSEWYSGQILGPQQSKFPSLQMEQESRFTITGTIGTKISVTVDQDSKRETDLENTINISYTGEEDDIIQKIEAGNTTLSLPGATFVGYSERVEGLFGIKSAFQIGDISITAIASQEKGQHERAQITGTTSTQPTDLKDYNYLDLTYFWIDSAFINPFLSTNIPPGDTIIEFKLYVDNQISSDNIPLAAIEGEAMPIPGSPYIDGVGWRGYFHLIDESQYQIMRTQGWFRMTGVNQLSNNFAIACTYILKHSDGTADTIGGYRVSETGDTLGFYLNLIRPPNMRATSPCWEYTWRNVYYLGSTGLNPENINVEIYLSPIASNIQVDTTQSPPRPLLEVFALDLYNQNGNAIPDGKIDRIRLDIGQGHLVFPVMHPFSPNSVERTALNFGANTPRNSSMYRSSSPYDWANDTKYIIRILTGTRQNPMSLGRFNIIENSEIVKLNGRKLQNGIDYRMDYKIGQITFLTDEALNPNNNLTIDFDYEPFFMPEQKALLGARTEYKFGESSWIGGTALYKSTSSGERRPRIGREPGRAFIWDADLKLDYEVPLLTDLVSAIPLIHTEAPSRMTFTAEVAEIISDPNTKGEAYLDDFEGAQDVFNLEIRRTAWHLSSAPAGRSQSSRGKLIWYNPYDKVSVKEIWPQKEVAAEESKTNVLVISLVDTAGIGHSAWGGVMRYIHTGYWDQSKSKFLEVWVRGNEGKLHVNLGAISEDINGDGVLNSEDKPINGVRDGILTKDEDSGLDGLFNQGEPGYDPVTNPDPNRDDWNWSSQDPYNYSKINGTEGNSKDPEGGNKPDTEDLDGNDYLDTYNNYFEFTIDLTKTDFEVEGTRSYVAGSSEYWRLFRIPIQDSVFVLTPDGKVHRRSQVGSPDWERIKYARLWVDNIADSAKIWIAQIELVGNKWEEQSKYLQISTKNTHEDSLYESPPDVTGERSVTTGIMSQEQSLVLRFDNVPGRDTVLCFKTNYGGESMNLTLYERLEMWVYLNDRVSDDSVMFVYRMGRDKYNMYEYRVFLKPGWDENNKVIMDFPVITAFKDAVLTSLADTIRTNDLSNVMPLPNGAYYAIRGSPTLTDIRYFEMGVANPYRYRPIYGEVWVDELKVTMVRKKPGWAERTSFRINFADLATFDGSLERKDSEFHSLNELVGSGETRTVGSIAGSFNSHKFAPDSWGLSLPISGNYTQTVRVPRLKTGSDISVPETLRAKETTRINQYAVNITETLRPKDPHWLIGLTLARLSHSISGGETKEKSPNYPLSISQNLMLRQTYDLTPKNRWDVHLTRWMFPGARDTVSIPPPSEEPEIGLPDEIDRGIPKDISRPPASAPLDTIGVPRLLNWRLNLAPTTLRFETSINERRDRREDRFGNLTRSKIRTLDHLTTWNTNPVKPLTTGFQLRLKRDIGDSAKYNWTHPIIIGIPLQKQITENIRYNPATFKWLNQNYEVTATYTEDTDPQRYRNSFGSVQTGRTYRVSWGLRWRELTNLFSKTPSGPSRPGGRRDLPSTMPSDTMKAGRTEPGFFAKLFGGAKPAIDRLDDVQFDWQRDERKTSPNFKRRPQLAYQLSLTDDPGVPFAEDSVLGPTPTTQLESRQITENTTIRTGARLPFDITTSLRYNYRTNVQISTNRTKQTQLSFPDITANWNGLGKLLFFPKIASNVRTNGRYARDIQKNFQSDALTSEKVTDDFNPLVSVNMGWKFGINTDYSMSLRNSKEYRYTQTTTNVSRAYESSHKFTTGYTIRGAKGFKIPLLGTLRFENQLALSLTVQNSSRKNEAWTVGNESEVSVTRDDNEWSITPSARYNFSRNIQGGMEIKWIDTKDKKTNKIRHVRDVSIWVELRF